MEQENKKNLDKKQWYLGLILVWAVGVFLHFDAINHSFVFDDFLAVVDNSVVTGPLDVKKIFATGFWGATDDYNQSSWRPLTVFTFALNHALGGLEPAGFHLVNLLLHGAAALLVALLVNRFGVSRLGSLIAAGVFAVHPLHVECIVPVVGRADLLMGVTGIAALLLWEDRKTYLAIICLAAALLSKEMGVIIAGVMVWREWTVNGRFKFPVKLRWILPIAVVLLWTSARYILFGKLFETRVGFLENPLAGADFLTKLWTTGVLYLKILGLVLYPKVLLREYAYAEIVPLTTPNALSIFGLAALLITVGATIWTVRRLPALSAALGLWSLGYMLVSHLGPTVPMIFAERVFYLPTAGLFIASVIVIDKLRYREKIRHGIYATLIAACFIWGYRSLVRVPDWRDRISLCKASLRDGPENVKNVVDAVGTLNPNGMMPYDEALRLLLKANDTSMENSLTLLALSGFYIVHDNGVKAKEYLDRAEKKGKGRKRLYTLKCAYAAKFESASAESVCEKALAYKPNDSNTWMYYAISLDRSGEIELAENAFRRAIEKLQYPNAYTFMNFGVFLANHNRLDVATKMFEAARQINPDNVQAAEYLTEIRRELKR